MGVGRAATAAVLLVCTLLTATSCEEGWNRSFALDSEGPHGMAMWRRYLALVRPQAKAETMVAGKFALDTTGAAGVVYIAVGDGLAYDAAEVETLRAFVHAGGTAFLSASEVSIELSRALAGEACVGGMVDLFEWTSFGADDRVAGLTAAGESVPVRAVTVRADLEEKVALSRLPALCYPSARPLVALHRTGQAIGPKGSDAYFDGILSDEEPSGRGFAETPAQAGRTSASPRDRSSTESDDRGDAESVLDPLGGPDLEDVLVPDVNVVVPTPPPTPAGDDEASDGRQDDSPPVGGDDYGGDGGGYSGAESEQGSGDGDYADYGDDVAPDFDPDGTGYGVDDEADPREALFGRSANRRATVGPLDDGALAAYPEQPIEGAHPVLVQVPLGRGQWLLHTAPILLTNAYLAEPTGRPYVEAVTSYLPAAPRAIVYDRDRRSDWRGVWMQNRRPPAWVEPEPQESVLRELLARPALRGSWYMLLAGALAFVVVGARRRQRAIPVVQPLRNTTVDFLGGVARLYLSRPNNRLMARKELTLFEAYCQRRFGLAPLAEPGDRARLAELRGVNPTQVEALARFQASLDAPRGGDMTNEGFVQLQTILRAVYLSLGRRPTSTPAAAPPTPRLA